MRSRNRRNRRQIRPSATSTLHNHRLSIINVLRCAAKRRARRRLAENLRAGPRLPLGQARRSEFPGADLRNARRGGRRGRPPAHLVPPKPGLIDITGLRHRRGLLLSGEPKPDPASSQVRLFWWHTVSGEAAQNERSYQAGMPVSRMSGSPNLLHLPGGQPP